MSWNTNRSIDLSDKDVLFTWVFTAQSSGSCQKFGSLKHSRVTGRGIRIYHRFKKMSELKSNFKLSIHSILAVIGLNLAEQGRGTFKVTDITGRTIKLIEKDWAKGYNEIWIDCRDIKATGVLYYSFEGGSFRASKKWSLDSTTGEASVITIRAYRS